MLSTQPMLDRGQHQHDNASLFVARMSSVDSPEDGTLMWPAPLYGAQESSYPGIAGHRLYNPATRSELFTVETWFGNSGGTVPFSLGTCQNRMAMGWADEALRGSWLRSDSAGLELEERYGFRVPGDVRRFLQTYPHLTGFLLEAFPYLEKHFGSSPHVELEVIRDPEIGRTGELIASILTPLSVDDAQARLDGLDDEWFLDELDRVDGLFNFSLEFI
jgi:hypothetical protein